MGFSLFGYDQGLMSGIITGVQFNDEFPATKGETHHATVVQGAVTSCYEIGCFFGALFALFRGERIGRKPLVLAGAMIIVIGTVISSAAFGPHWGLGQFVVGRVITGIGNGLNTATIPVWQSEMSKAENRGFLVNLEGSVIAIGTLVAYWIDFGLSYVNSSVQWRFPVAFQIVFALIVFGGMWHMPESPRWLIAHDRIEEARAILAGINSLSPDDAYVSSQIQVITESLKEANKQVAFRELFTHGRTQHFRRMLIGSSTQFFQQFTGCNAAIYYSTVLFENSMHQSKRMSLIMGGVFSTIYAIFTIPSFFMIEKVGRRKLFLIGAIGQGCSFLITFGCLVHPTNQNAKGAAVGLFLFISFFAFTILPLPWIYPPEINPNKTRTAAASVSTCTNWLSNFAVVMFTPIFIAQTEWGCYLFFALINFLFVPIIFFFYPETAGRSLEEVDIIFAKSNAESKPAWRVAETMPYLSDAEVKREAEILGLVKPEDISDYEKESEERVDTEQVNHSSSSISQA
ncbi:hexose transporter Hxt13p [Trichomonascus vanleenenianus]|uniref:glucose-inactivated glycerol proton symporter STL1 n=1 Tax=Trichomonascus vanleenenianus TaxID=2268995 RepID=UPI003EC9D752